MDAADYSVFSVNQQQGLNGVAPHPVHPGFHSLPLVEVSMNSAKWEALPDDTVVHTGHGDDTTIGAERGNV